jgi:hypothetical protein
VKGGKGYWELGRLGPDLETTELQAKREKAEKIKALAAQVGAFLGWAEVSQALYGYPVMCATNQVCTRADQASDGTGKVKLQWHPVGMLDAVMLPPAHTCSLVPTCEHQGTSRTGGPACLSCTCCQSPSVRSSHQ